MTIAVSAAPPTVPVNDPRLAKARATAEAFEAVLLGQLTGLMLESAQTSGEFSGGHGEEMFRGVLAEKIGVAIAKRGGIGLAPAVTQQILLMQQGSQHGQ